MECSLRLVKGNWHARFKYNGTEYSKTLRTANEKEAKVRLGPIQDTLYRLEIGTLSVPQGVDPKQFIVSGGSATSKPQTAPRLTVGRLADDYLADLQGVEDNTRLTLSIHLNHFKRLLGSDTVLETLGLAEMEAKYVKNRSKEQYHGNPISSYTIRKELRTFRRVWASAAERGRTQAPSWLIPSIKLPKDRGRERFRSFKDIQVILKRGGVPKDDEARLWETLYLNGQELQELLAYVRDYAQEPWVYPMVAFVALTGCRRAEMCRSRLDDWDIDAGQVHIREKKRDTAKDFTMRTIRIHPELLKIMSAWFEVHPGGQHAISPDGSPLSPDNATYYLKLVLRPEKNPDPRWSKIPGFHTLRHSLASILASKGKDQRYIDAVMGHQTEEMRARYQHLFPQGVTDAIDALLG